MPAKMIALLMAAAAVSPVAMPAQAAAQPAPPQTGLPAGSTRLDLSVNGTATRVPDLATIQAGVTAQNVSSAEALAEVGRRMDRVMAALKRAGIDDKDIRTSGLSLNPNYRYRENEAPVITGYQATNTVSVKFRDLKRAGAIIETLTREGANQVQGPSFSIEFPQAALDEARIKAVREGRQRADTYARALGLRVLRVVSVSESGNYYAPPPPPPMMERGDMKVMAVSAPVVAPGTQELQINLAMVYELG